VKTAPAVVCMFFRTKYDSKSIPTQHSYRGEDEKAFIQCRILAVGSVGNESWLGKVHLPDVTVDYKDAFFNTNMR
jgi:hypothetical protein